MPCKSRVPRVATDSASLALFLPMEDAALMVDSALGKVTLLVLLLLIVLSVHASGVDAALHVDVLGVDAALSDDVALLDDTRLLPFALPCHSVCGASLLHSDASVSFLV